MDEKHFRDVYIKILTEASSLMPPYCLTFRQEKDSIEYRACSELTKEGYIVGQPFSPPPAYSVSAITVKGRLFLLQLKREDHEDSWGGWIWSKGAVVFGFILGTSADLFKDVWVYVANHFFPGVVPPK